MTKKVCDEFEPVDVKRVVSHINLETVKTDLDAIQDLRNIERNEARRKACTKEAE